MITDPTGLQSRRQRAWEEARRREPRLTAFLVTGPANVRYLSGFTGSNGCLLVSESAAVLATDTRYEIQAAQECPGLEVLLDRDIVPAVVGRWVRGGGGVLLVEGDHLSVAGLRRIHQAVSEGAEGHACEVIAVEGVVEDLRRVKEPGEMAVLRRACEISDAALAALLPTIQAGQAERDIARRLENLMLDLGADAPSFESIVGAGPNSAIPHHRPSSRCVEQGDLLLIDFGALVEGYHADQTRTFVVGTPSAWQCELHAVVLAAQESARAAARAGAGLADVDRCARGVIEEAGQGERFGHGLGHGVGLEIHEAPMIGPRATGMLDDGSAVTVEPGVYLPGMGGVRIEDTVAISAGPSVSMTATERGLTVLG